MIEYDKAFNCKLNSHFMLKLNIDNNLTLLCLCQISNQQRYTVLNSISSIDFIKLAGTKSETARAKKETQEALKHCNMDVASATGRVFENRQMVALHCYALNANC